MKKFLTLASIFSGLSIIMFFLLEAYIPMFIEIGITMFLVRLMNDGITKTNKIWLLILSIINLPLNFLSSIFSFLAYGESDKEIEYLIVTEEEKKNRKILSILNIGTLMVILSGFVFVTTSEGDFSDYVKTLFLILGSILFGFLYFFTQKHLKMALSSRVYYLISIVFLGFTYYSIGNYELLGNYFSIYGEGSNLFLMTNFIVDMLLCILLYKKYEKRFIIYGVYTFSILALLNLMNYFNLEEYFIISIFTLFVSLLHFIQTKKDTLYYGYVFLLLLILCSIFSFSSPMVIFLIISTILQLVNLVLFSKKFNFILTKILTILFGIACIFNFGFRVTDDFDLAISILVPCLSLFYIYTFVSKNFNKEKEISLFVTILMNLIFIVFYFISLNLEIMTHLVVTLSIMLTNIVYFITKREKSLEYYLDPLKKLLCIVSCFIAIESYIDIPNNLDLSITILIFLLFFMIIKEKILKNIYFAFLMILIFIATILGLHDFYILDMTALMIGVILLFIMVRKDDHFKYFRVPYYVYMLFMIYHYCIHIPYIEGGFIGYLLVFLIYGLSMCFFANDKKYFVATSYLMALPMFGLITSNLPNEDFEIILYNLIGFYFLWITNHNFIKKDDMQSVVTDIVTIALLFLVVFSDSILLSIYAGIISFVLLSIGFSSKKYEHLFTISIVATIINIIVSFKDFWLSLNLWFYLLIIGVLMIAFATYKEMKK